MNRTVIQGVFFWPFEFLSFNLLLGTVLPCRKNSLGPLEGAQHC